MLSMLMERIRLNLNKPAADGIIVYKHADFIKELEKLFGLDKKRKERQRRRGD